VKKNYVSCELSAITGLAKLGRSFSHDTLNRIENRADSENSLASFLQQPDPPVHCPYFRNVLVLVQLLHKPVAGGGEVLGDVVPHNAQVLLVLGWRGDAVALILEDGQPRGLRRKLQDDGGGGGAPVPVLAAAAPTR
jgi:hypothetical protein